MKFRKKPVDFPYAPNAPGSKGQIVLKDGYLYTCIKINSWERKWVRDTLEPPGLPVMSKEEMIKLILKFK